MTNQHISNADGVTPAVASLNDGIKDLSSVIFPAYYEDGYPWQAGYENQVSGCSVAQDGKDIRAAFTKYSVKGVMLRDAVRHAEITGKAVPQEAYNRLEQHTKAHTISYAYPTSPTAAKLGKSRSGCWIYSVDGRETAVNFQSDALLLAANAQTVPTRWSTDHAANAQFKLSIKA